MKLDTYGRLTFKQSGTGYAVNAGMFFRDWIHKKNQSTNPEWVYGDMTAGELRAIARRLDALNEKETDDD